MGNSSGSTWQELDALQALHGLSVDQRSILKDYLEKMQTARGETICVASAPADRLVFVLDGQLTIERGGIPSGVIGPGELFGIEAVLGHRKHPASVRTQGCCTLLALSSAAFDTLAAAHPTIALALLRGLLASALTPAT